MAATASTAGASKDVIAKDVIAKDVIAEDITDRGVIEITSRALEQIRRIAANDGVDLGSSMLRVAVVPGGCSGLTYDLGWDTTEQEEDRISDVDGIRIVLDRRSAAYVQGTELDFSDGLDGEGFHFMNPQAARTCACGESFGL